MVESYTDSIDLKEVPEKDATAVTVKLRYKKGDKTQDSTETFHEIQVDGAWRWLLEQTAVDKYRAGECPSA